MAAVVVRVESQELLVDLVEHAGATYPSTLSPVAQTGRGAQVPLPLHLPFGDWLFISVVIRRYKCNLPLSLGKAMVVQLL